MRRRDFIAVLGGTAAWPWIARAQQVKTWRIGILETIGREKNKANLEALHRGFRQQGYVEGENLLIEYRSSDGHADRFSGYANELVRLKVDLIVTRGTPAARAAKNATTTIPVVMAAIGEPLGTGVVENLARPGGNVTGFSAFVTELAGKRIELIKEMFPATLKVGFLHNMANPVTPPQWEATKVAAGKLGLSAVLIDVQSERDIFLGFASAKEQKVDALATGIDGLIRDKADLIIDLARAHTMPTVFPSREFAEAGGLASYGVSYPALYFRAAVLADKILNGVHPGSLPVEQPTKLELIINLKCAQSLGWTIPPSLLARADEVIE